MNDSPHCIRSYRLLEDAVTLGDGPDAKRTVVAYTQKKEVSNIVEATTAEPSATVIPPVAR